MEKENILLIDATGFIKESNRVFVGAQFNEPLSLLYLAASLEKEGFSAGIMTGVISENEIEDYIKENRPLAVGFCAYSATLNTSVHLSRIAKQAAKKSNYEIFVIFGGYHASALPKETISNDEVDFVIKGEGDITICELMKAIKNNEDFSKIDGLFFKMNKTIIENPARKRITNLDSVPNPIRYSKFIQIPKKDVTNLSYPSATIPGYFGRYIYSRGCPFACSFCASKNNWGQQIFWRSPKLVVDEMEELLNKFNVNYAFFIDLTFNANKKKTLEFCDELIKRDLPIHWGAMVRLDLLDRETIEAIAKSKGTKFSVGLESPNPNLSGVIKDNYESKKEHIKNILDITTEFGILIRAFVIIGFPHETKEIIETYPKELTSYGIDELRITIATPFPNTQFWYDCEKNDLLPEKINWDDFTTEVSIIKHPTLTNKEILELREKLLANFYFSSEYLCHVKTKITKNPRLKKAWLDFFKLTRERKHFQKYKENLDSFINSVEEIKIDE